MSGSLKTQNFRTSIDNKDLLALIRKMGSRSTLGRVVRQFEAIANKEMDRIVRDWPVSTDSRGVDKIKGKVGHSRDMFSVKTTIQPSAVKVSIVNSSRYAYMIKSRQPAPPNPALFKWRKGDTQEEYRARITTGPKRRSWAFIGVKPFRKATKDIGDKVASLVVRLARS